MSADREDLTSAGHETAANPATTGSAGDKSSGFSELVVETASSITERPVEWLWPSRLPLGKISLLGGDPGLGKSLVSVDMAARVSTGRPWPDRPNDPPRDPGRVLILTAEDDPEDTLVPRLRVAGADLRAYPITIPECIIFAPATSCRLSEEVQGWTNKE